MEAMRTAIAAAALVTALMFTAPGYCEAGDAEGMFSPVKVRELMVKGSGFWLIDVRSSAEFEQCHIEGSMNIPGWELSQKHIPEGKLVVLVDDSIGGLDARKAGSMLTGRGVKKVRLLDGGIYAWASTGYPLAGSSAAGRKYMPEAITASQLNDAIDSGARFEIFDLRDGSDRSMGMLAGSVAVDGADLGSRINNLAVSLSVTRGGSLAAGLSGPRRIVLVLPRGAAEAEAVMLARAGVGDVRYLSGGYETLAAGSGQVVHRGGGGCASCP